MNKRIILFGVMILGTQISFSNVPSLMILSSQSFFKLLDVHSLTKEEDKQEVNRALIDGDIDVSVLKFNGMTLKDVDLSGMYLRGIDFSGCTFINVDLRNADLTDTKWDKAKLDKVSLLKGAILYYPLDQNKKPLMDQALRINTDLSFKLTQSYSELMSQARKKDFNRSDPEVEVLLDKADCLNKIIGCVMVRFPNAPYPSLQSSEYHPVPSLQGLDFIYMNLSHVFFRDCNLRGVWLSRNFQVPNYTEHNRTDMFELWAAGNKKYQQLWNSQFNLIKGVNSSLLHKTLEKKVQLEVDLRNGYLAQTILQGIHLEKAKLQYAILNKANLQGAYLNNAQLQYAFLVLTDLRDAKLQHANLSYANLQDAYMQNAQLQYADLTRAYLRKASLEGADFKGVKLSPTFALPNDCKDEDLVDIYNQCTDREAKEQLKHILVGKRLMAVE